MTIDSCTRSIDRVKDTDAGPGRAVRTTRKNPKSAATQRRILDATARVLIDVGYSATRLTDIADIAGVQAGSIYYYFASRESLIEEVLRYGVQFTQAHVRATVEAVAAGATPGERISAAIDGHLEAVMELGALSSAHVHAFDQVPPDMQERLRPIRRSFGKFWADLVDDAIESGDLRGDLDPYLIRLFIVNMIERVPEWSLRTKQRDGLGNTMHELLFEGVKGQNFQVPTETLEAH